MSAQRQAEDAATADTVIHPPRRERAAPEVIEPDLADTIVPLLAPDPAFDLDGADSDPPVPDFAVGAPDPSPPRARPGQYAFRLGDRSEIITLGAPSYVGRRPQPPRVPHAVAPHLVRVDSPLREVSATHLEIRQIGSSIVVRDLATTNGSIVHLPGSVPRALRQGESIVVSPGTLIDIGDENVIHILPMQGAS